MGIDIIRCGCANDIVVSCCRRENPKYAELIRNSRKKAMAIRIDLEHICMRFASYNQLKTYFMHDNTQFIA